MLLRRTTVIATVATAGAALALVAAVPASADPAVPNTYNAVGPVRVVSTSTGLGTAKAALGPRKSITVKVTGPLGSASVSAVALNLTAISPKAVGGLIVYPAGTTRRAIANVNYQAGGNTSNSVIAKVGSGGRVTIFNSGTTATNLVADLYGYWTGGTPATGADKSGSLTALQPARLVDSRTAKKPIAAASWRTLAVAGHGGVPATGVAAVAVNVVAIADKAGYLSVSPAPETPRPAVTSLYYNSGEIRGNLVIVPLNSDGSISIYNGSTTPTNYVVDVQGYVADGTPAADGAYVATTAYRAATYRIGEDAVAARSAKKVQLFPNDGSGALFKSVAVNLIAFDLTATGALRAYSGVGPRPPLSVDHFTAGHSRAQTTIVPVNKDGSISVYNTSDKPISLAVDIEGFVLNSDLADANARTAQHRITTALQRGRSYSAQHNS